MELCDRSRWPHLHAQAIEQERKGDLLAGLALLPLHDAIELFLRAAAGEKDVPLGRTRHFWRTGVRSKRQGFRCPQRRKWTASIALASK